MADLDDFFAKKDKKKGKAKKFVTAEEIAKQLDDTSKKAVESKMKKPIEPAEANTEPKQPDDEWMEVKEQKKDYSGLKLAQLTIDDESNPNNDSEHNNDPNDPNYDGEAGEGGDRDPTQPWNKLDATAAARAQVPTLVEPVATSNVYISPALKNLRAKQKKGAPDLKSEEYFPTLGMEKPEPPKLPKKDPTFEDVKHGGRVKIVEQSTSGQVSVGNRFTSLSNDAS